MIRSPSIASLVFSSSLVIVALLAGPVFAEDAKIKRGQWPSVEAGAAKSGDSKGSPTKPSAASPSRQAPEKLTPAGQLNALTGLSMSRDGKSRSVKVPNRVRGAWS